MRYRQILTHILHLLTCLLLLTAVAVNKNGKVCGYSIGNRDMVAQTSSGAEADVADVASEMLAADTVVISSIGIADKVIGYAGTTPVEISIANGRIVSVVPLDNDESPRFMRSVVESGLFERWNGLTLDEAVNVDVDAVSGATYTSMAAIKTVRLTI